MDESFRPKRGTINRLKESCLGGIEGKQSGCFACCKWNVWSYLPQSGLCLNSLEKYVSGSTGSKDVWRFEL